MCASHDVSLNVYPFLFFNLCLFFLLVFLCLWALLFAHRDPGVIAGHLSEELTKCKRWLVDNRLSLHVGKTEAWLFGSKRVLEFHLTGHLLNLFMVKYLGVTLDSKFLT